MTLTMASHDRFLFITTKSSFMFFYAFKTWQAVFQGQHSKLRLHNLPIHPDMFKVKGGKIKRINDCLYMCIHITVTLQVKCEEWLSNISFRCIWLVDLTEKTPTLDRCKSSRGQPCSFEKEACKVLVGSRKKVKVYFLDTSSLKSVWTNI